MTKSAGKLLLNAAISFVLLTSALGCGKSDTTRGAPADTATNAEITEIVRSTTPTQRSLPKPASTTRRTAPVQTRPNPVPGQNKVSGRVLDSTGRPVAGADIYFYIVPRSFGSLYRTKSGQDGLYTYNLPAGFYNVMGEVERSSKAGDTVDLVTAQGELSVPITVPPGHRIDFLLP